MVLVTAFLLVVVYCVDGGGRSSCSARVGRRLCRSGLMSAVYRGVGGSSLNRSGRGSLSRCFEGPRIGVEGDCILVVADAPGNKVSFRRVGHFSCCIGSFTMGGGLSCRRTSDLLCRERYGEECGGLRRLSSCSSLRCRGRVLGSEIRRLRGGRSCWVWAASLRSGETAGGRDLHGEGIPEPGNSL